MFWMRSVDWRMSSVCALAFALVFGGAVMSPANAQTPTAASAFDRLKSLQGEWTAKMADGSTETTSFRATAAGSVVVQMIGEGTEMEMPTMYHLDGDRLIATHYCAAKNQPRMELEAEQNAAEGLKFKFLDVTNLKNPGAGHMRRVAFKFIDADHIEQEWIYHENGKETPEVFRLTRKS
jgi:hypothetical protein